MHGIRPSTIYLPRPPLSLLPSDLIVGSSDLSSIEALVYAGKNVLDSTLFLAKNSTTAILFRVKPSIVASDNVYTALLSGSVRGACARLFDRFDGTCTFVRRHQTPWLVLFYDRHQ